ncbi:peroxiredoxin [Sphingomonas tabacisoli]|uniref:thioredoxin-dependent peroxiredoxin n=1 Tax=Sphingomonas tabacisoli TaxID=2249466 RepID=A0ABW4HZB7_9SPHN
MVRTAVVLSLLFSTAPAFAALPVGATAPDFSTQGALAGKPFSFTLKQALKKGPVVLYFYPKAFTQGCTIEAHEFAEATPEFNKLGATVIGMSGDDVDTLKKFSTEECRNKFAVATATPDVIKSYDVTLPVMSSRSNRTSYVIAPNGKIVFAYSAMSPEGHVSGTLDAVKKWKAKK